MVTDMAAEAFDATLRGTTTLGPKLTGIVMSVIRTMLSLFILTVGLINSAVLQAQSSTHTGNEPLSKAPTVVMRTTLGDIVIELDAQRAPRTVDNFLAYVDDNFYADTLFHRVIEGFMIQGGGFTTNYQRKTTRAPVGNEAYNGLRNQRYTIAMARTNAPHSATSQFFINTEDNRNLDHTNTTQRGWGYTVFGTVIEGQSVVDAIATVRTGAGGPFGRDVPIKPVVILGIERTELIQAGGDGAGAGSSEPADGAAAAKPADPTIQSAPPEVRKTNLDVNKDADGVQSDVINQN